jgi:hypothetical protein
MGEILELKDLLLKGDMTGALAIVEELENMINRPEILNRAMSLISPEEQN